MNYQQNAGAAQANPQSDILTHKQAPEYLAISRGLLAKLADLPKANIGRRVVYRRDDIAAWLARRVTA
jgi:predicted DNA-binding transcriptional regulator AlpA